MINWQKWERLKTSWSKAERIKIEGLSFHEGRGNGDLLYNTCRIIIEENDTSKEAHHTLEYIFVLLDSGKRWPDWIDYRITSTSHKQTDMTQDPWIMAYCCAVHLDRYDLIERYKPSKKIFNLPDKWAWRRALLGKPNMYWLWRRITPHFMMQWFVYVFYGFMDRAYLKKNITMRDITRALILKS